MQNPENFYSFPGTMGKKGTKNRRRSRSKKVGPPERAVHHARATGNIGSQIGSSLGGMLGNFAQKGLGRLFGMGEYKEALSNHLGVEASEIGESEAPAVNSLVEPLSSNEVVPLMHQDSEGTVRVCRRELVELISIQKDVQQFNIKINPGLNEDFPWLSSMARSFQMYAFTGIAYEYVPTSGYSVSSDSAALGQVTMAPSYNPTVSGGSWPSGNIKGLANMSGAVSGSPAAPSVCYIECDPTQTKNPIRYILNETTTTTGLMSLADYNLGVLLLETEGAQATTSFQCGQLWVTYEVLLYQPRPVNPAPALIGYLGKWAIIVEKLVTLLNETGPFTSEQLIICNGEIRRLESMLRSQEYCDYLEAAQLRRYRDYQEIKQDDNTMSPVVAKIIAEADNYQSNNYAFPTPPALAVLSESTELGAAPELIGVRDSHVPVRK